MAGRRSPRAAAALLALALVLSSHGLASAARMSVEHAVSGMANAEHLIRLGRAMRSVHPREGGGDSFAHRAMRHARELSDHSAHVAAVQRRLAQRAGKEAAGGAFLSVTSARIPVASISDATALLQHHASNPVTLLQVQEAAGVKARLKGVELARKIASQGVKAVARYTLKVAKLIFFLGACVFLRSVRVGLTLTLPWLGVILDTGFGPVDESLNSWELDDYDGSLDNNVKTREQLFENIKSALVSNPETHVANLDSVTALTQGNFEAVGQAFAAGGQPGLTGDGLAINDAALQAMGAGAVEIGGSKTESARSKIARDSASSSHRYREQACSKLVPNFGRFGKMLSWMRPSGAGRGNAFLAELMRPSTQAGVKCATATRRPTFRQLAFGGAPIGFSMGMAVETVPGSECDTALQEYMVICREVYGRVKNAMRALMRGRNMNPDELVDSAPSSDDAPGSGSGSEAIAAATRAEMAAERDRTLGSSITRFYGFGVSAFCPACLVYQYKAECVPTEALTCFKSMFTHVAATVPGLRTMGNRAINKAVGAMSWAKAKMGFGRGSGSGSVTEPITLLQVASTTRRFLRSADPLARPTQHMFPCLDSPELECDAKTALRQLDQRGRVLEQRTQALVAEHKAHRQALLDPSSAAHKQFMQDLDELAPVLLQLHERAKTAAPEDVSGWLAKWPKLRSAGEKMQRLNQAFVAFSPVMVTLNFGQQVWVGMGVYMDGNVGITLDFDIEGLVVLAKIVFDKVAAATDGTSANKAAKFVFNLVAGAAVATGAAAVHTVGDEAAEDSALAGKDFVDDGMGSDKAAPVSELTPGFQDMFAVPDEGSVGSIGTTGRPDGVTSGGVSSRFRGSSSPLQPGSHMLASIDRITDLLSDELQELEDAVGQREG